MASTSASATPVPKSKPAPLSNLEGFICGGLAGCAAATVSNPAEMAKTRLQLDAELNRGKKVYANTLDVFKRTWQAEGIKGIQRGLAPAYAYQILLNGCRLGFYEPLRRFYNTSAGIDPERVHPGIAIAAGASSGILGAMAGNPLFLVKARIQAYSPTLPVGHQRYYKSTWDALRQVYLAEGFKGYIRGMDAAILRTGMGSMAQLPSYGYAKSQLVQHAGMNPDGVWTFLASSSISGVCVCIAMQPGDTALTRMYNQPTQKLPNGKTVGLLYKNPFDCLWKTLKAEGVFGWYKGTVAHFWRIAPHTIVTLTANEMIVGAYRKLKEAAPLERVTSS